MKMEQFVNRQMTEWMHFLSRTRQLTIFHLFSFYGFFSGKTRFIRLRKHSNSSFWIMTVMVVVLFCNFILPCSHFTLFIFLGAQQTCRYVLTWLRMKNEIMEETFVQDEHETTTNDWESNNFNYEKSYFLKF